METLSQQELRVRAEARARQLPQMTEEGMVLEVRGGMIKVQTIQNEACSYCSIKGACDSMGEAKERLVMARNEIGAKAGDRVLLALPRRGVLGAGFLVYMVPILVLILGASLGKIYALQLGMSVTNASVVLGLAGLVISFAVLRPISKRLAKRPELTIRAVRIVKNPAVACPPPVVSQ